MKNAVKCVTLIFSVLFCGTIFVSMAKNTETNLETVIGTIRYQGNMPLQYPCIKTQDEKIYTILADEKTVNKIKKTATAVFEFKGKVIANQPGKLSYNGSKDGYFELYSYKILKK